MDRPPIANGAVVVNENEILSVLPFSDARDFISAGQQNVIDLGEGVIIPGLVNAHTHLEFSDLTNPLGEPGINFTDWIRLIVAQRAESNRETDAGGLATSKSNAIKKGIRESSDAGVFAIGEIATLPFALDDYQSAQSKMLLTCFLEQLGRDEAILNRKRNELAGFLDLESPDDHRIQCGASPHAPYSVGPGLLRQMCGQSSSSSRPLAMHLAETLAERELIENQTGDFVELLQDFGVWDSAAFQNGPSFNEIIQILSDASRSLVVHGNYLSDDELDQVAANSDRMSIAFCPRTHQYFGHSTYPLEKLLKRSINVCLGTDSRASNPDLDLFQDAKQVAKSFSKLAPQQILAMATINGALALGISKDVGSITAGKLPAMSYVVHPDAGSDHSPFEWMFDDESTCSRLDASE